MTVKEKFEPSLQEIMDVFKTEISKFENNGHAINIHGSSTAYANQVDLTINGRHVASVVRKYRQLNAANVLETTVQVLKTNTALKEFIRNILSGMFSNTTRVMFEIQGEDEMDLVRDIFKNARIGIAEYKITLLSKKNTDPNKKENINHYNKQLDLISRIEKSLKIVK